MIKSASINVLKIVVYAAVALLVFRGVDAGITEVVKLAGNYISDADSDADLFAQLKSDFYNTTDIKERLILSNEMRKVCIADDWENIDNSDVHDFCRDIVGQDI